MSEVREGEEKRIIHWNVLDYILRGLYCYLWFVRMIAMRLYKIMEIVNNSFGYVPSGDDA